MEENFTVVSIPLLIVTNPQPANVMLQRLKGGPLNQAAVAVIGDAVEFHHVSREEAGIYMIDVTNSAGSASLLFILRVECE